MLTFADVCRRLLTYADVCAGDRDPSATAAEFQQFMKRVQVLEIS
jgi:hypothetical protein